MTLYTAPEALRLTANAFKDVPYIWRLWADWQSAFSGFIFDIYLIAGNIGHVL